MRKGPSRKEQGYIWFGHYHYARKDKRTGKYKLYAGYWSYVAEDCTTGLEVEKDRTGKILEFGNVQQVKDYLSKRYTDFFRKVR